MLFPRKLLVKIVLISLATLSLGGFSFSSQVKAATYTVTSTADSGAGTLRQAILDANANSGLDTINFSISGGGVKTITLSTTLPIITSPVTIDGTTQTGYSNSPLIKIVPSDPLVVGHGLDLEASGSTIKGLALGGFTSDTTAAIYITGGGSSTISGNYIGLDTDGATALQNGRGIWIVSSNNNTIGGNSSATRNIISGNDYTFSDNGVGVIIEGTSTGNYIGTNAAGTGAVPNEVGVRISTAAGNTIGGTSASLRNVISGNGADGIEVVTTTAANTIVGNYVGTNAAGTGAIPNGTGCFGGWD